MSHIDWTIAQAQGGRTVGSELEQGRVEHETALIKQRENTFSMIDKARAAKVVASQASTTNPPKCDFRPILAMAQVELINIAKRLRKVRDDEESFRLRHGITRPPKNSNWVLGILICSLMVMVETASGFGFFQSAMMASTIAAAILMALVIACVNVLVSSIAGFWCGRYLRYGSNAMDRDAEEFVTARRLAKRGLWLYLAVIFALHIVLALVRSQENMAEIELSIAAFGDILHSPDSIFLILMGASFSVLAYHNAITAFADPYPGYDDFVHQAAELEQELHETFEDCGEQLSEGSTEYEKQLQTYSASIQQPAHVCNEACDNASRALHELNTQIGFRQSAFRQKAINLSEIYALGKRGRKRKADTLDLSSPHFCFERYRLDAVPPEHAPVPDVANCQELAQERKSDALLSLSNILSEALTASGDYDDEA